MTKQDRKALGRYIRWVANEIGLRDWTFDLLHAPADDGIDGSISCLGGRRKAHLSFTPDFRDLEPDRQRHVIVHELVHAHFEGMSVLVEDDLQVHLGRPAYDLLARSHERALEHGVDAIAEALAKHLPLIEWPEPTRRAKQAKAQ